MPQAAPMMALSLIGVSITRSQPNRASNPSLVLNAPPYTPTSSPSRTTAGSRSISSNIACRMPSRNVTCAPPATFPFVPAPFVLAILSPRLSRSARRRSLHGLLCCRLCQDFCARFPRAGGFLRRGRRIAKMNRGVRSARAFAGAKSRHGPHRRNARFRRRHFRDGPLPLRANLVAIVARAVHALLRQLRRRHRRIFRKLPFLREQRVNLVLDLFLALRIEELLARQILFIQRNGIAGLPVRPHLLRHVFGRIVLRVAQPAECLRFNQDRAFASASALDGFLRRRIHRHHVIAVHNVAVNTISLCAVRQILKRNLLAYRRRIRPQIVLQDQNERRLLCRREIQSFVKNARRAAAVPNPRHGHDLLPEIPSGHGHAAHHRDQIAQHGNRRNDVQVVQVPEMAGSVLAFCRRIVFRHVLHENVARRHALHQQRADIPDHRRQPVLFFQRVCRPHRDGFLPQARVKSPDNFVLPEQLHHGVFDGAVQTHVVVQVQALLPHQFLLHPCSGRTGILACPASSTEVFRGQTGMSVLLFYADAATGSSASCSFSSSSARDVSFNSSPKTSPKCLAIRGAISSRFTLRPSSFSSEVALQSAIPHGTIKSKYRKSVETLYANPCDVTHRLMCTPMAANFSSAFSLWTQIPVFPSTRFAATPNSAVA